LPLKARNIDIDEFGERIRSNHNAVCLEPHGARPVAGDPGIGQRNRAAADAPTDTVRAIVTPIGDQSTRAIAKVFNDRAIPTPRGGHG